MADKLRSVNTRFWEDSFVEELTPSEKLLFLYLLTNPQTNIIGVYEVTLKRIAYDTGLNQESVRKGLERFETVNKVLYFEGFIILLNFLKHQNLNPNMKLGAVKVFNELPTQVKTKLLGNDFKGLVKDYQTLSNGMVNMKYEYEVEDELEIEGECESKKTTPAQKVDKIELCKQHYRAVWIEARDSNDIRTKEGIASLIDAMKDDDMQGVMVKSDHPTYKDLKVLFEKYGVQEVIDTYRALENSPKHLNKYKSIRLTIKNWIKPKQ